MIYDPKKLNGKKRSPKWPALRRKLLEGKRCAVCGGTKKLELHHIKPFHVHPELELDPHNLIPLCEGNKNLNCHLMFGHFGNFSTKYNLAIRAVASGWLKNLLAKKI